LISSRLSRSNIIFSAKHSSFSSTFPIYIFTQRNEEVPDEVLPEVPEQDAAAEDSSVDNALDEDEAIVEAVADADEAKKPESPKTKTIVVDEWIQLNPHPPIWMR
jgi:heat shock protein 90kDa beta